MFQTIPGRFAGRTVVVTGAGSGIGKATALRFAAEGARVVLADFSAKSLDAVIAAHAPGAGDAPGGATVDGPQLELIPAVVDVTATDAPQKVLDAAGGRVDVLVNNAGIMDGFLPAAEVDDKTWDAVFAVNVTGPMRLVRAVLPGMIEARRGAIVNICSEAALRGSAAGVAYTASKHAVVGLTKSTAATYRAEGIRCNAVAPGPVNTGIEGAMRSEHAARVFGPIMQVVVGALAEPEALAATITWLASDDAANVNGVVLPSDGGWSAI